MFSRRAGQPVNSNFDAQSVASAAATRETQSRQQQPAMQSQSGVAGTTIKADSALENARVSADSKQPTGSQALVSTPDKIDDAGVRRAIDTLTAVESTYPQKQNAWKDLIRAGKLDEALAALEQKRTAEPLVAGYAATLGHGYLNKCGTLQDVREQAILAMQADKLFDTALNLDPGNWEARFTKAVAMSYWPATMNKGGEVIGQFQGLIQQQEVQPARPEFAEAYLWLGDQYEKMGQRQDALMVWQRGAGLFPIHQELRNRLALAADGATR